MTMHIEFLGHSGFLLSDGTHGVAVDPFLTGNPLAKRTADSIECGTIAVTHGHADHVGDTLAIAKANGAELVAAFEICEHFAAQGVGRTNPGNPGGRIETSFGWIAFTQAFHSSSYEGKYMGMPCGLVIHLGGVTLYHCGDTALFSDMKLIGELYRPKVACIPIGDRFTMGPAHAARAAGLIGAPHAIPIHYDTWPPIEQDPASFDPPGVDVRVMKAGDTWSVEP